MTQYSEDGKILDIVDAVTSVVIRQSCTTIRGDGEDDYAFLLAKNTLETCTFEEGSQLQDIQQYSFYECQRLKTIDLSICYSLKTIGAYAFFGCSSLALIQLPESLQQIDERCFSQSGLKTITIPPEVTTIGQYCFADCSSLTNFQFAENSLIQSLTNHVLIYTNIISFYIPKTLRYLTPQYCPSLINITVAPENPAFTSFENVVLTKNQTSIVWFPNGITGNYTIPETVTSISYSAFMYSRLTGITFPLTLTTIGGYSFEHSQIVELTIPSSCRTIGDSAFRN